MIKLGITFNVDQFVRQLDDVGKRKIPTAMRNTLNDVQVRRQRKLQEHVASKLTIRSGKTQFRNAIRFAKEDRATKEKLDATIRVSGDASTSGAGAKASAFGRIGAIILRQNTGGPKTSSALYRAGKKLVTGGFIIPSPGLRSQTKAVPRHLYPASIGLAQYRKISDSGTTFHRTYRGGSKKRGGYKKNTRYFFTAPGVGIFERRPLTSRDPRTGRLERDISAVWFFRKKINLPRRLRLLETFLEGLGAELQQEFATQFGKAK